MVVALTYLETKWSTCGSRSGRNLQFMAKTLETSPPPGMLRTKHRSRLGLEQANSQSGSINGWSDDKS